MASFSENAFVKKLSDLNPSQQSIQTLSLWLIHHRKHAANIVKVWYNQLVKAAEKRKITFIYLANDVIQNSKKKGPEYGKEFATVLPKAFEHMATLEHFDDKSRSSIIRVLTIWEERGVYDSRQISELKANLSKVELKEKKLKLNQEANKEVKEEDDDDHEQPEKKRKHEKYSPSIKKERKQSETTELDIDGVKEIHTTLYGNTPAGDPPEADEIIKAILDLENAASGDVTVRETIAKLPPEVSDISALSKLQDKTDADNLSKKVNEAVALLNDYTNRLALEMEERKRVMQMLRDFTQTQNELLAQAKQKLEEYQEKLHKVHLVRAEVKSHIQNLPDLTQLPDVTGGLAPLPSAGDLFNV